MSESPVEYVRRYIEPQEEHHRTMPFQGEFGTFSSRHRLFGLMNGTLGIDRLLRPFRAFCYCASQTECDRIRATDQGARMSMKGDALG